MSEKMWGSEPFWGLGYEWDPDWVLTERQKELRALLIELCEKEMRANAKRADDELLFPRRNLELLGEHGFLGLTVPEEYGGLGENHVAFAMTCETISRYGCASASRDWLTSSAASIWRACCDSGSAASQIPAVSRAAPRKRVFHATSVARCAMRGSLVSRVKSR